MTRPTERADMFIRVAPGTFPGVQGAIARSDFRPQAEGVTPMEARQPSSTLRDIASGKRSSEPLASRNEIRELASGWGPGDPTQRKWPYKG